MRIMSLLKKAMLYPSKIPLAARIELKTIGVIIRYGQPEIMLQFLGGIGDELLLTTVARELRKRDSAKRIWQVSHSAELLRNNPDYGRVFDWNCWPLRYSHILDARRCHLSYSEQLIPGQLEKPPGIHIIAELCKRAGIRGEISIRPYVFLTEREKASGRLASRQITLHCVGEDSYENVMKNKIWYRKKFESVVDMIREEKIGGKSLKVIQVGIIDDPLIPGCLDLRGKTTLRETATIISQSDAFIGTSGLLSHLARAVDSRSVIIYGGREHSYQTGYICNENLDSFVNCAPCWQWNRCDFSRKCMEMIKPEDVIKSLKKVLQKGEARLESQEISV
jgi:hypothetical protein